MACKTTECSFTWESPNGAEFDLRADVEWTVENDGIGAYEYWGAKCYDAGTNYVEVQDIKNLEIFNPRLDKWVPVSKAWADRNDSWMVESATTQIEDESANYGPDYDPPDYDDSYDYLDDGPMHYIPKGGM